MKTQCNHEEKLIKVYHAETRVLEEKKGIVTGYHSAHKHTRISWICKICEHSEVEIDNEE